MGHSSVAERTNGREAVRPGDGARVRVAGPDEARRRPRRATRRAAPAATLCDLADVSRSGFHRDHKPVLLEFGLVERRADDETAPTYVLAETEQADHAVRLHYALQSQLENSGSLFEGNVEEFVR